MQQIIKYTLVGILSLVTLQVQAQCEDNGNYWNDSWVSCAVSQNPNAIRGNSHWILYEFHETQYVDSTHIWNANRSGESGWGAKEVIIDYSSDGLTWTELGAYTFAMADESETYAGFPGPDFEGAEVQKILITILNTHDGGDCASIAEIQIGVDENACFGILDECGVCDGPGELIWYLDADSDGLGDENNSVSACEQPDGYVSNMDDRCDNGAIGWEEIESLFSDNGCNGCHGAGAAGGIDLRNYNTVILGGNTCGTNLISGTTFVDVIVVSGYDGCGVSFGPSMNDRASGEFDADELEMLQNWINGGAPELCEDFIFMIDADGDGFSSDVDCDDNNADINPDATELCDGIDNNCNGEIDENLTEQTYYMDIDGDGYGDDNTAMEDCTQPANTVSVGGDCDDNDAEINPDAMEIANNGIDENCDGIDEIIDADGDGFNSNEDCDDNNPEVYPGASEICDGIDNNCNDQIDEGLNFLTYYLDMDGDGFGDDLNTVNDCTQPINTVLIGGDCDDSNPAINPEAEEICDGLDNNCDINIDEDLIFEIYYADADGDGYGDDNITMSDCEQPVGMVSIGGDCDDNDPSVNPDAEEICDDIDNNCDGNVDENLNVVTYYVDEDGDGFGNDDNTINDCMQPAGTATIGGDCDDNNPAINPEAEEIPNNGIDENCDDSDEITAVIDLDGIKITILPNPVSDRLFITVDADIDYTVHLYDSRGRLILKEMNPSQLDVSQIATGLYIIQLQNETKTIRVSRKVIVAR